MTPADETPNGIGFRRGRRRGRRRPIARVLRWATILFALAFVYFFLTFVQVYRSSQQDGATQADAIIVLGAAQYNGRPSPVLQHRLDHALELYEEQLAPTIVLTGGRQVGDTFTEATAGYNYLRSQGVPDDALLKEVDGTSSWESLSATARFLIDRDQTKVVLVTDGYHAMRVGSIADDLGLDASVSPIDSRHSRAEELRHLARETLAVGVGRVIGYDRLFRIDNLLND
ncbi:MAG: YdcF family protein [Actinomycetota bacterium]|nr:YdcF family protein [Actinomycetota bacterium]